MKKNQIIGLVLAGAFALSVACSSKSSKDNSKEVETMAVIAVVASTNQSNNNGGSNNNSKITASCIYPAGIPGNCIDYQDWTTVDAQTNCAGFAGTSFSTQACVNVVPTAAPTWVLVGSCLLPVGVSDFPYAGPGPMPANYRNIVRYYSPQFDAGTAQANCVGGGGTFTP